MDDSDIPMLDVGDFEVLDECADDDEVEVQDEMGENKESDVQDLPMNDESNCDVVELHPHEEDDPNYYIIEQEKLDEAVDLEIEESDFLDNVANDLSENIEDDQSEVMLETAALEVQCLESNRQEDDVIELERTEEYADSLSICEVSIEKSPILKKLPHIKLSAENLNNEGIDFSEDVCIDMQNESERHHNGTMAQQVIRSNNKNLTPRLNKKSLQKEHVRNHVKESLKKEMTDEEIMIHLDEIENTVLSSSSFIIQDEVDQEKKAIEKKLQEQEENWDNCEIPVIKKKAPKIEEEDFSEENMWYKEKIDSKVAIVIERFSKLARVLQYSYPLYKKWLDKVEALYGTSVVKIEKSRHVPLDQLHSYRWKFICHKKRVPVSSMEEENADDMHINKNGQIMWKLGIGAGVFLDASTVNPAEYPPYIVHAVQIIENFMQATLDQVEPKNEISSTINVDFTDIEDNIEKKEEPKKNESESEVGRTCEVDENVPLKQFDQENSQISEKENKKKLDWLSIVIRANHEKELLIHITGRNFNQEVIDKLKDIFESDSDKGYIVKSLYCKSLTRKDGQNHTNTFLIGSEVLDDYVGGVKIHLSPNSNQWTNIAGAEVLGNVIAHFLMPTMKTTVVEIGCGVGLTSLMLAKRCQKVIGLDSQSEIEEAEMTCELNGIKNASFVTGNPGQVMAQIARVIANCKAVAVINTNVPSGRSLEVMTALRKMNTLSRIVMITTLTKQSIRSILELTRPADEAHGYPFIPTKACVVDTHPKGPMFEIVMLMERRKNPQQKPNATLLSNVINKVGKTATVRKQSLNVNKSVGAVSKFLGPKGGIGINPMFKKGQLNQISRTDFKPANRVGQKKLFPMENNQNLGKFQHKKSLSTDDFQHKEMRRPILNKIWQHNAKKSGQQFKFVPKHGSSVRVNPMHDKKLKEQNDQADLRSRLSGNRKETDLVHQVKQQQILLDAAKNKLSGSITSVDVETVKQLQQMLNLAIEKTNKLQTQLPRSVWDRIAPAGSTEEPLKGRFIQETGPKEIIITTPNMEFNGPSLIPGKSKKYDNLPLLEPDIMPLKSTRKMKSTFQKTITAPYQKPGPNRFQNKTKVSHASSQWSNRSKKQYEKPIASWTMRSPSPRRRQENFNIPLIRRVSPRLVSPPRPVSPPRRPVSPYRLQPPRNQITRSNSPTRRPFTPPKRISSPSRHTSPKHFHESSKMYEMRKSSPTRHQSPTRRQMSPEKRFADEWDIPTRGAVEQNIWSKRSESDKRWPEDTSTTLSKWTRQGDRFRLLDKWDIGGNCGDWNKSPQKQIPQQESSHWHIGQSIAGGDSWNIQRKENAAISTRDDSWKDNRHNRQEPRWDIPKNQFSNDKDDWNDLPEDARDPWGDDPSPLMLKDRFNKFEGATGLVQWSNRDIGGDNWQKSQQNRLANNISSNTGNVGGVNNTSLNNMGNMSNMTNMGNIGGVNNMNCLWPQPQQSTDRWVLNTQQQLPLQPGGNWQSWQPQGQNNYQRPFNPFSQMSRR